MKNQINKIIDNNKKINNINKENKILNNEIVEKWNKNNEEAKKLNEKYKNNKKQIDILNVENAILKDNIYYLLKNDFEILFKNKLDEIFENEKSNKKHFDKLIEYIKEYYKKQDILISCYIRNNSTDYKRNITLTIDFLNDEGFKSYVPFNYNEIFTIEIEKYFNNPYNDNYRNKNISYNYNVACFVEDTKKEAKRLLKEKEKTEQKIEKLRLQQKELYHNFNDYLTISTSELLHLKSDISIY